VDEDEQQEGESDQNFDHTWNLDGKNSNNTEDDDARKRDSKRSTKKQKKKTRT
jgi:hypothetical protein